MPSSDPPTSMPPLILNVDDHDAIRYARSRTLTQAGYRLVEASSGEDALLMAATLRPRLIVLDVELPGIDGLEVCRRIKADPATAHTMVLQVSAARGDRLDRVAGLEGGADAYLIEPIDGLELVATVRALLRLADREAENLRLIRRLSRTERQFVEATESADCGLWDWDIPSGKLEWFGAHERLAGMQPGSFSGKVEAFRQVLHPDDRARVWDTLHDMMARREERWADEYRFVHPDGSVRWMSAVGRLFYDESGQAVRMTGVVQDVTKRKAVEEALRESEEHLRHAMELNPQMPWTALPGGSIERLNERWLTLTGLTHGEARADGWVRVTHEEDRPRLEKTWRHSLRTGDPYDVEHRIRLADGRYRWMRSRAFARRDSSGEILRWYGTTEDVHEQKQAEEARHESEERLRLLVDGVRDYAIFMLDADGKVSSWNAGAERILGYRADEILGRDSSVFYTEEAAATGQPAQDLQAAAAAAAAAANGRYEQDEWRIRQDGSRFVANVIITALRNGEQSLRGFAVALRDVSERKRVEEALQDSERFARSLVDTAPSAIYIYDILGQRSVYTNPGATASLGYSEPELQAMGEQFLPQVMHPDDQIRIQAHFAKLAGLEDGAVLEFEYRMRAQNGVWRWFLSRDTVYRRLPDGRAHEILGTATDITERKQAEQALEAMAREAGRRAQEAEESRRLLMALMEYIPEGITIADAPDVTIRYVSKYGRTLIQRDENDVTNIAVQEHAQKWGILRADDGTPARNEDLPLTRATQRGEVVIDEEWTLRRPDGSLISLLCNAGPIRGSDGTITGGVIVWRDITARKRADLTLRLERERLALALGAGQMGVYELDMVEDRLWWSPEIYRVFGVSPDAFTPTRDAFTALVHPDDRDALWRSLEDTIGLQQEFVHEFRIVRPDGAVRWIGNRAQTVYDAGGRPIRHYGVAVDMTERKQAEEQLRRSRDAFFNLMQDAPFGVYVIDRDFRIHQVNAGAQAVFANVRPLIGRDFAEALRIIWPEPFASEAIGHFRHTLATGEAYVAPSLTQRRKDSGEIESYEWQIHRIMLPDGQPGVVCYFYESTEIRRAEDALAQRERELRIITDSVPSLISYVDAGETYRFVNAAYEQMFGRPRSEIAGRTVAEVLGVAYENVKPYIDRVLAGEAVRFETEIVYEGRSTTVLASYTPDVRDDGSVEGFYVLVTDITERKRQEEELRRWKEELEVRVQERTQELVVSQERLRELASQLTMAEQRERQKLAHDLHDYLAQMLVVGRMKMNAAKKQPGLPSASVSVLHDVDTIFQQALTYTRTLIGELSPPSFRDYGLPAALKWLSERMQKDGLWVEVQADREQVPLSEERAVLVFQCVRELLFNVLKHATVDRATVRVVIEESGGVRVSVEDRGKGLDREALQRAAQPGHLGLFAVRERMESMGGSLDVASVPGQGTTVTLSVPEERG